MNNKTKKWSVLSLIAMLCLSCGFAVAGFNTPLTATQGNTQIVAKADVEGVAKVGNTGYATINEAIANWTDGSTLTLLSDVQLTKVIELSSTEYHILDLGTYTMTAASGNDAIQIVNNGRSSASYALDIKADATNPGGITASGKAVVKTTGKSGVQDRPIIRFYNGVFNASNIVYHTGSNGTYCPQFQFRGGVFNGNIYTNRSLNQFYGGTFTGSLQMSVDSSAYTLIAGGTFKNLSNSYGSALNSGKFTIGSAKGVYDKEVYVDDNGNYVIATSEPAEGIEAAVAKTPGTNDYLAYSKVATEGQLNYTDVKVAIEKNNTKSAKITVYADEIDLAGVSFKGTIVVPEGQTLTITNAPEGLKVEADNSVAQIGNTYYATFEEAVANIATDGNATTIKLLTDVELENTIEFNYGIGDIIFTADAPVTIKQVKEGLDLAFTKSVATNIVVEENVTFEIYDNASGMYLYYGPSLTVNGKITGGQNWGVLYLFNGEHSVSETGQVNVGRLQVAISEATVKGSVDTNYLLVEGATFTADDATVKANVIYDNNNGGQRWGASEFKFINGSNVITSKMTLSYADSVLIMDLSSKLTADTFVGAGKITIDAKNFSGEPIQVIKADMSSFTGTIEVINCVTAVCEIAETGVVVKLKPAVTIADGLTGAVVEEIKNNTALQGFTPTNLPEDAVLAIELTSVEGKIVYDVTPVDANGAEVEPTEAITFRLPVPASVTKSLAKVYHDGTLMGTYEIKGEGNAKYVEVSSADFSKFAVEPVVAVAKVGEASYASLQEAINAAQAGDTITVVEAFSDVAVKVDKNLTITGEVTLNKVSISGSANIELTVSGLTFTGNSWIDINGAKKLTVSGVTANVTPSNSAATNSRSAFISLGRSEGVTLDLTVENCNIVSKGGSNPILGWAAVKNVKLTGNTFGSASAYQTNSDSVKFMSIADGAEFTITGNTIYSNYNGIVFAQNTTRDNAYSVYVDGNTFMGGADHIWIEVSGSKTVHIALNATSDNTVNGNAFTTEDIKHNDLTTWTAYAGVDLEFDENGKVVGGQLAYYSSEVIADGYEVSEDGRIVKESFAKVNDVAYATLEEAFAAAQNDETITLLADVAIDTMIVNTKTVVLNLNGKTITGTDNTTKNFSIIDNKGTLTITGNGTITLTATVNSGWNRYSAVIANNPGGKLVIENGTIQHLGGTDMAYAIDNLTNGKGTYAETVINGGTIKSTYRAIRQFLNGVEAQNILTINGGTVEGANKSVWMQDPSTNANSGTLTIDENAVLKGDVYLFVTAGSTEWPVSVSIASAALAGESKVVTGNVPASYVVQESNGVYGVVEAVVVVNGVGYTTLKEALAAASALTGDVTVEVYEKVTLNQAIIGSFDSISFVGKDTDAEIYLDVQGYITATGKDVSFTDLKLSKSEGGYVTNAGFMNLAFGIYDVTSVAYTNCYFVNGACASFGEVTFKDCTFMRSHDRYGLWAYGDVNVTVDGCTFADFRGIKMYSEGMERTAALTVKNTDFSAVNNKPAIVLTSGESVVLENNTYSSMGALELDLDGVPNGTPITTDDLSIKCVNDIGVCGVIVDGKIYTTVAQAAAAVREGSTVTLLHTSTETVELPKGTILDKNGYTADGVTVKVGLDGEGTQANPYLIKTKEDMFIFAEKVNNGTYQNVYVVLTANVDLEQEDWISIGTSAHPFTGTFDGQNYTISNLWSYERGLFGYTSVGNYVDGPISGRATIKNFTLNGVEVYNQSTSAVGGVIGQAGQNTEISNVTVTGYVSIYGYGYVGGIVGQGYAHIDNCKVIGVNNDDDKRSTISANYWAVGGIIGHAGSEGGASITNCSVSNVKLYSQYYGAGAIAGVGTSGPIENVTADSVAVEAQSNPEANGFLVGCNYKEITGESYTKDVTLTVDDELQSAPQDMVANVNGVYYTSLQYAIDVAAENGTVQLLKDVEIGATLKVVAGKTVVLDLNGKTIDGTGKVRIAIMSYGNLTIKDSSAEQTGIVKAGIGTAGNAVNICAGTFTMESGAIYSLNNALLIDEQAATININGGKLTAEPNTRNSAVMYISSTSDTVVNITAGELVGYNGILLWNNTTVNMIGGSIEATGSAGIQGNGTCDNTEINISNGTISGYYTAIYHPQGGKLNISGGTLTGWTGIVVKGGVITISGGTISGTGAADTYRPVSSGYVDTGDGLYVECYDNSTNSENYGKPTITVTGGTFSSLNAKAVASYANNNNNVEAPAKFISGGTFSNDIAADLCAEGFVVVENADGTYGVEERIISGKISYRAYVNDSEAREAIQVDLNSISAYESVVIKLYDANGNLLTTTSLNAGGVVADTFTCNIVLWGRASSSWTTTIAAEKLTIANVPETIQLWIDGELLDTFENALGVGTNVNQMSNYIALDCVYKEAQIGSTYYVTLAEAIEAAQAGDVITLLADVELNKSLTVAAGKTITLDLNGKTIAGTDTTDKSFGLINNKGNLTITDSVGGGKITLTATVNSGWNRYSSVVSNQVGGKLVIENGTIEHLGGTDMAYAIDNLTNGKGTYAETVINGGTIKSTYRAIRQFLNGVEAQNILTINGGTVEGTNKSVWFQDPSNNANSGKLTIGANATINGDVYLTVTEGSTEWPVEVSIASAALGNSNVLTNDNVPESYVLQVNNGVYGIVEAVAKIGEAGYATLAEAYDAAQSGDTLTLLADVELSATLTIKKSIIINGNGKTLTYTGQNRAIDVPSEANGANVTIKNLTVDCTASYCQRGINYNTFGTLTLDNVVVKGQNVTYVVNLPGSSDNATVIINNSALSGNIALNIWGENTTVTATDTVFTSIDNTEAENYFAISINNDGFTAAHNTTLTINGGEIIAKDEKGAPSTAIGAATFATITVSESTIVVGSIMKPVAIVTYAGATEFYSCVTLQDAVNKASNDPKATVKLIANIELSETVVVNGTVVLDLNGKTITGTDNNTSGNFYLINNDKGNLTIIDSVGGGKITLEAKNERNWNASSVVVANNLGTVTVKGGTIEHLGGTSMAYAIDNLTNGANTVATLNVEGGTIESTYFAIRQFANGGTNYLNISGGDIGYTWMQSPNVNVNVATIKVTGGEVDGICLTGKNADVTMEVAAGTTSEVYGTAPAGMTIVGTPEAGFGLMAAVAKVGEVSYASLQEAINAANNATVVVLADIDLGSTTVKIPAGTKVTLDLNGKTISGECNANQASMFVVENTATFIVKDTATNGKITYAAGASNVGFEIDVKGAFVLESGIIELTGSWSLGFAVDVRPNSWGSEYTAGSSFVMNGGKISSSDTAVRVASSSATGHENVSASFTMNGGVIESGWDAIFIQHGSDAPFNVELNDGTVSGDNTVIRIYGSDTNDINLAVKGGTYTGKLVNLSATGNGKTAIQGGTFSTAVEAEWCAEGFEPVDNGDGTFGVAKEVPVSVNLTIGKDLSVNFYIDKDIVDANATVSMIFSIADRNDETVAAVLDEAKGLLKFTFKGVGPQKMGKTITAQLVVDGEVIKTVEYSIETYCYAQLKLTQEQLGYTNEQYAAYRSFLVNLLNYGAASQVFANYDAENLVTDNLTAEEFAYANTYHAVKPIENPSLTPAGVRVGKTVLFGSTNKIRFIMMATDASINLAEWKVEVYGNHHMGTVMDLKWDAAEGYYYIEVEDILATEYNIQYIFMIVDATGAKVGMNSYSIQHYVNKYQDSTSDVKLANLVKAVWNYGHAANDYIDLFY